MELSSLLIYDGSTPIGLIIWSFYIAVVIGAIIAYLTRVKFGKLIFALLEKGACTPETALTLEEAEIKAGFFIKFSLKNHMNYKDLLVAITADGKYYANTRLTDEPPTFKTLVSITRKKRSRIVESPKDTENDTDDISDVHDQSKTVNKNVVVYSDADVNLIDDSTPEANPYAKPQRPSFRVETAKYYIPEEIHAKVKTVYKENKVNILWLILILIGLGLIAFFGVYVAEALIDSVKNIGAD